MGELRTIAFKTAAEPWKLLVARVLKASAEEKGVLTKGAEEWVRVADLAGIDLIIDLGTRTFNVSPQTKPLLENLVREYLLLGVRPGGEVPDG